MGQPFIPPVRSSQPAADYIGFLEVLNSALDLHLKSTQVPDGLRPTLVEDYPKTRTGAFDNDFDVILFHVVEAQPAATSNDGSRRPQALTLKQNSPHPEKDGYRLLSYGWKEEAIIQFTLLTKSNMQANRMASWFQRFLNTYIHGMRFFGAYGVEKFYFVRRLEDEIVQKFGQDLYARALQYHVRLNFMDSYEVKGLELVSISVSPEAKDTVTEVDIRR